MTCLLRKNFRELKIYWSQFISVFFMALIAIAIFSGMAAVWNGLDVSTKKYVEDTNLANYFIYTKGIWEEEQVEKLEELSKLDGVEEITLASNIKTLVKENEANLNLKALNNQNAMKPFTMEGEKFETDKDGIWIDKNFAEENGFKLGDYITVKLLSREEKFQIKGLVLHSEYIYYTGTLTETIPNHKQYGYGFISKANMDKLNPFNLYSEIRIKSSAPLNEESVKEIFGDSFVMQAERSNIYSYERVNKENSQMKKTSTLFSVIFVCLSLLTMHTSMMRLVQKQKILIGTMKAIGLSKRKIRLHYALYGLLVSLSGSLLGLVLGKLIISPRFLKIKLTTISIPNWELIHSEYTYLLIASIVIICMVAAVSAANKALRGMPAETMRNSQNMDIKVKQMRLEKSDFIWSKISYYWRWVLRDISRNKARFIMGVIGVMGGMVLLVAGLGGQKSIYKSNDFVFEKQFNYDTKAIIVNQKSVEKIEEEKQVNFETEIDIDLNGSLSKSMLTVCDEAKLTTYFDLQDEKINLDAEEAVITRKLAEDLELSIGDKLKIRPNTKMWQSIQMDHLAKRVTGLSKKFAEGLGIKVAEKVQTEPETPDADEWQEVEISNITKNLTPQGIVLSKNYYEERFGNFVPNIILVNNMSEEQIEDIGGFKSPITKERQILGMDKLVESVDSIVTLQIIAALMLTVVILYNLGTLNFIEKTREYATLKVLGFKQEEIRSIVIKDCILTIIVGWIIGIFASIKFLKLYIKTISFDNFEWRPYIDYKLLGVCSLIVILTSITINLVMSSKVRKISMVESLKSVE